MRRAVYDPGCQRNPGEPLEAVTLSDRDETTTQWLVSHHEDDGWIPDWLAEYLDRTPTTRMTEESAREWVTGHNDGDNLDPEDLEHAFAAIFGRRADDQERTDGLWSHLCS